VPITPAGALELVGRHQRRHDRALEAGEERAGPQLVVVDEDGGVAVHPLAGPGRVTPGPVEGHRRVDEELDLAHAEAVGAARVDPDARDVPQGGDAVLDQVVGDVGARLQVVDRRLDAGIAPGRNVERPALQ
jgi:hypothetical protein